MRLLNHILSPAILFIVLTGCSPADKQEVKEKPEEFFPLVRYSMLVNEYCAEEGVIRPNQQFIELLNGRPVPSKAIRQLNTLPRKTFDFRSVRAGDRYVRFIHEWSDSVTALVIEHDPVHYTVFHFRDSLRVERCENPVTVSDKVATGTIETNLSETIQSLGLSPILTNRFVDIFAWQVDFYHLQKGDHFKILYKELSVNGKPFDIGKIDGIYFNHNNNPNWAIPFDQGKGLDYFDEDGNSIRKALLKYPIEFTRISSQIGRAHV